MPAKGTKSWRILIHGLILTIFILLAMVGVVMAETQADAIYVGVDKCKNCHQSKTKGDQYDIWKKMDHAKAWATLATDKAKEFGKAKGIDDPQKSDKCFKCHVTAYGVPAAKKDPKFDDKNVQCEACHGPGSVHVKARLAAAAESDGGDDIFGGGGGDETRTKLPAGEMNAHPDEKVCLGCHNSESPSFKSFNFEEAKKKIAHPDPRVAP